MMRERVMRKAKERAVEHLHEITTNYYKSHHHHNHSNANNNQSDTSATTTPIKSSKLAAALTNVASKNNENEPEIDTPQQVKTPRNTRQRQLQQHHDNLNTSTTTTTANAKSSSHHQQSSAITSTGDSSSGDDSNSLFQQIFNSPNIALQTLIDDWIERYKVNRELALLELIHFLIRSSGCKNAKLNKTIFKTKEYTEVIAELIDYFDEEQTDSGGGGGGGGGGGAYPLINSQQQYKRFKQNFCEFLQLLINQCQYSIIYDQFMIDNLITFLIGLSDSQIRAFRHTATLALLKIMTSLVDVLLALSVSKDAYQRQYDNEKQKSTHKRASDRLDLIINKRKEIEENEAEIQNFINFIFKAVFIHRYRDVCADIRTLCMIEIGEWMKKCPSRFLDDTFLKYIGWTLYDRIAECRLKCLQALHPLYEHHDLQSRLELFTSRFKQRIIEMCVDKDADVAVHAIKLLTLIVRTNESYLEERDCESIYELVFHINRSIAQSAGEFLNQKLFDKVGKTNSNKPYLQLLIQFLIESELHDHPTYLVDAMWDVHPMLKDWKCMTDMLLNDDYRQDDSDNKQLDDMYERYLIEIMSCCVRQAATGEYPIARQHHQTQTQQKQKQINEDKQQLTQHFIQTLPKLLIKYNADADKLVYLLQIPLYFDLNQYTIRRQEKNLENLLQILNDCVSKHISDDVLSACSLCLSYLCDESSTIYNKCNLKRSILIDSLIHNFKSSMNLFEERTEVDLDELYPLIISLKRLSIFSTNHDLYTKSDDCWPIVYSLLRSAPENDEITHEIVNYCFNLARNLLCWHLNKLDSLKEQIEDVDLQHNTTGDAGDGNTTTAATGQNSNGHHENGEFNQLIEQIKKQSRKYYKIVNKLFVHNNKKIEEESYFELCDLLILFNKHMDEGYKSIVIDCLPNDINMLILYCINSVYKPSEQEADTSDKIEELHKRRRILSAFCKLIVYNTIPIRFMADICRGYLKYSSSYGDIIKQTLMACRDISRVNMAKTISLALQREFNELIANQTLSNGGTGGSCNAEDMIDSSEFDQIKELARKFLFLFAVSGSANAASEAVKQSRESLIEFHMDAIKYVNDQLQQNNLVSVAYFSISQEFILNKYLTNVDKKQLLKQLTQPQSLITQKANKNEIDTWKAYFDYRDALIAASSSTAATTANEPPPPAPEPQQQLPLLSSTLLLDSRKRKQQSATANQTTLAAATAELSSISSITAANTTASNSRIEITKINMDQLTLNENNNNTSGSRKRSRSPDDELNNKNDEDDKNDEDEDEADDDDEGDDESATDNNNESTATNNDSNNITNNNNLDQPIPKRTRTSNSPKASEPVKPSFVSSILK